MMPSYLSFLASKALLTTKDLYLIKYFRLKRVELLGKLYKKFLSRMLNGFVTKT